MAVLLLVYENDVAIQSTQRLFELLLRPRPPGVPASQKDDRSRAYQSSETLEPVTAKANLNAYVISAEGL